MHALLVGTVVAMTLAISACRRRDSPDDAATETTVSVDVPDVIGETVEEATATLEAAGLTMRIIRRDGEDLAATA